MRADQFITKNILLEYNREITLRSPTLRKALVDKFLMTDWRMSTPYLTADLRTCNRMRLLKIQNPTPTDIYSNRMQELVDNLRLLKPVPIDIEDLPRPYKYEDIAQLIDYDLAVNTVAAEFENRVSRNNDRYLPWIMREYAKPEGRGGIRYMEDLSDTDYNLTLYEQNKRRRGFPQEAKDINKLSAEQLRAVVRRFNPEDPEGIAYNLGNYDVVYGSMPITYDLLDDKPKPEIASDVVVIHPKDKAAAVYFGRVLGGMTEWCTAYIPPKTNQFDYYNSRGPMYIIIPQTSKYEGEKYQIHMNSNQIMNEDDNPVSLTELLVNRFPELKEPFTKILPGLENIIAFADPQLIMSIWKELGQIAEQYAHEMISHWEMEDEYYNDYLADFAMQKGYVDSEGDIDWERVHEDDDVNYLNYNDQAREFIKSVESIAKYNFNDIVTLSSDDAENTNSSYNHHGMISEIEKVFANALMEESVTDTKSSIRDLADIMTTKVDVKKLKVRNQIAAMGRNAPWRTVATIGDWAVQVK